MSGFYNVIKPKTTRPPVWFLRQVGRYMPQYKELKGSQTLKAFFHNTEAITEATLLGPNLLKVDAAICFADILSLLDGFNISYDFAPGPQISFSPNQELIFTKDPKETFSYLLEAIRNLVKCLKVPLIAFAASPFTMASYLLDGGASKDFPKTMAFLYQYPERFDTLLKKLTEGTVVYLKEQIHAGASAIQLFESSSLRLPSELFSQYVTTPNTRLISQLKRQVSSPISLFCRCFYENFLDLYSTGADTLHPDYHVNLNKLYKTVTHPGSLQGNIDPALFLLPQDELLAHLEKYLTTLKYQPNYIFNSGHGILPETPLENVQAAVLCLTSISTS
ncbi:Uroporphyrinogen decarboxylase,uroporphyrinogen decarboxylase,Uroporphyrinogen-III decarboxylase,uroporphyrinogen decarboxylase,Uroporphyrinogen decarboxylase (URO-D) [Chlamydia poikilotherma]|uniref:Uroporphyrinogen decarboxylase n=1 Tax=Chlamydia poikilotherma TaxID=1967783 RepID=A0A3B0PWW2_9CHLA|nr:uroporphyrinogen decarboxylase [Chlamydia poikilotherma]SYX09336.1 Uroporphyrinogen decarboxylase,uroporphyrinogen decarboxylase,Uroporphyrinogen-III decarboxylase,uroporphyrinogen decarboxylase,Uroporphyrinogen decarboxylase (URO-D) [Chlamydia poikilotherma]